METSILVCLSAYAALLWRLRRTDASLGVPFAYLSGLLLIHVPGALAHIVAAGGLDGDEFVEIGIQYTAIGAVSFVAGVFGAHRACRPAMLHMHISSDPVRFRSFCVIVGFAFVFMTGSLKGLPSLGAMIDRSSAIWILGVLLSLRVAARKRDAVRLSFWLAVPLAFSLFQVLTTGFLSYGMAAFINASSILALTARRYRTAILAITVVFAVGLNVFVNYFENRNEIRAQVGTSVGILDRINIRDLHLFDISDVADLRALDQRLNQNVFVGLSSIRIEAGAADFLFGRSIWEGLIAFIPRAVWSDKPVYGGSPQIVGEMTGLQLNPNTSFGVGNVMEFYINYGIVSLVAGFLILGGMIGVLDIKAAEAERRGQLGNMFFYFLPAIALIQPNGSIVELSGGAAAAFLSAFLWRGAWLLWSGFSVNGVAPETGTSTFRSYPP